MSSASEAVEPSRRDPPPRAARTVLFNRNFKRFQGGHLKVFHYFEHVRSSPAHRARIRFSPDSVWDETNPWLGARDAVLAPGAQERADILFLAGMDWRTLAPAERAAPSVPVVNLIQALRHVRPGDPAHEFLAHPAIRICVSAEIREALDADATVNGPVFTIPVGVDLERLPPARPPEGRDLDCIVLAVKDRRLGAKVARRVRRAGYEVLLVDEPLARAELLEAMARARVVTHIPKQLEGAYLPALESMALGAAVVCPDCVGNRAFCRDGETCLVPERSARSIARASVALLESSPEELAPMLAAARAESATRTLAQERSSFLAVLGRVEELWASLRA
jgi:glycosyltransferase involved in cell wall biosynthesis